MKTRVNQRPAVALVEGKDVDVIKRHGQRQAQPKDAFGHFKRFSRRGRFLERIADKGRRGCQSPSSSKGTSTSPAAPDMA